MLDMLTLSKKTCRRLGILFNCHSLCAKQQCRTWTKLSLPMKSCIGRMQQWMDNHQIKETRLLWSGMRTTRTKSFRSWGVRQIRIVYSLWMEYSLHHSLWKEQSLIFRKCSWLTRAIDTLESIHYFCVMVWQQILTQVLLSCSKLPNHGIGGIDIPAKMARLAKS